MTTDTLERGEFKRGRGGRPTRGEAEQRHRHLLATAMRLFMENGWEATSIDEISRRSGVAKRFIYARYPDKAALFVGAIERARAHPPPAGAHQRDSQDQSKKYIAVHRT